VFFLALREDQNVIEIGDTGTVNVPLENMVDKMLERDWRIV
jgi:hypothetical protein